jgi:nucleoside-diphosphate-sugar epimerase
LWELTAKLTACEKPADYDEPRPGDIVHSLAGIEKARSDLGFQPGVSFEKGLEQTVAWYRQNSVQPKKCTNRLGRQSLK